VTGCAAFRSIALAVKIPAARRDSELTDGKGWLQRLLEKAAAEEAAEAITFTDHARQMMAERQIEPVWVVNVLTNPEFACVDPGDASRTRAFGRVTDAGGRWLRVVYETIDSRKHVITTFFDRKAEQSR